MTEGLQDTETGKKIISIYGPCFSGKTTLILQLLKDFPEANVFNFELFFSRNKGLSENYKDMSKTILGHESNFIFTESVKKLPIHCTLKVVCWPDEKIHLKNFSDFNKKFGASNAAFRTAHMTIREIRYDRDSFLKDYDFLYSDNNDYPELVNKIKGLLCS